MARSEKRGSEARLEKRVFQGKKKEVRLKKETQGLKKEGPYEHWLMSMYLGILSIYIIVYVCPTIQLSRYLAMYLCIYIVVCIYASM